MLGTGSFVDSSDDRGGHPFAGVPWTTSDEPGPTTPQPLEAFGRDLLK
jgi:hypothetical protein